MARLILRAEGGKPAQVFEVRLGLNRVGRSPNADLTVDDATVSAFHCELTLAENHLLVRDCDSTNGTFIDGTPVSEGTLTEGQTLQLGDVKLFVESTEVKVAIPEVTQPVPPPAPARPRLRIDGLLVCLNHPEVKATYRCNSCKMTMCDDCVRPLGREGGKLLLLCPMCSEVCERIGGTPPPKKKFFANLRETIKLPFARKK